MTQTPDSARYPHRVRNELRFRQLTVLHCENITPAFRRIVLGGADLAGFSSGGFDDHTKLFFPSADQPFTPPQVTEEGLIWQGDVRPASRDYTPLFDPQRQELAYDFFIHQGGVACQWAMHAAPGDTLLTGGPRGSLIVPTDYRWQLYVCDESGLPALRRRLEMIAAAGDRPAITVLLQIDELATLAYLDGVLEMATIECLPAGDSDALAQRLGQVAIPEQDYFVWITGEGKLVKRLSAPLEEQLDPRLLRAAAYWHAKP